MENSTVKRNSILILRLFLNSVKIKSLPSFDCKFLSTGASQLSLIPLTASTKVCVSSRKSLQSNDKESLNSRFT